LLEGRNVNLRIRSSPDLLIYDEQKNDLMLVEVKMHSRSPPDIKRRLIESYKEFWDDSILVLVIPEGNVFYAQKISELETRPDYYRPEDFEKFQDIRSSRRIQICKVDIQTKCLPS